jgi:hypothetical protein
MVPPSQGNVLSVVSLLLVDNDLNLCFTPQGWLGSFVVAVRTLLLRLLVFYVLVDEEAATFPPYIIILNVVRIVKQHPDCRLESVSGELCTFMLLLCFVLRARLTK